MEEEKSLINQTEENPQKALHKVCKDTVSSLDKILDNRFYPEILSALNDGKATIELRKTVMLRAIDEKWIEAIEAVAPSIDLLTKNPRKYIEEVEYILPISQSTSIKPKSIRHLAQHVDYISKIEGDEVTPTKIMNIFNEETMMTYENKFLNTLIHRLVAFVHKRYTATKDHPNDSKSTKLTFDNEFMLGRSKAKINFTLEVEEPNEGESKQSGSAATGGVDLWRRLLKVNEICLSFENSAFCKAMGQASIRPPVIRTNAILKNKNFRECLALWEFIEAYEDVGYSMSVEEHLERISEDYIKNLYSTMAVEYLLFKDRIHGDFIEENTLASAASAFDYKPQVVEDLMPTPGEEFNAHFGLRVPNPNTSHELTELDHRILAAIDAALDADAYQKQLERLKKARANNLYRSFMSKIIQGSDTIQGRYTLIKNALLCYTGVKSTIGWTGENFAIGRTRYATIGIKGKSLVVYLNLDPTKYDEEKYHHKDYSGKLRYAKTPLMMRISGKSAIFLTIELIDEMLKTVSSKDPDFVMEDYAMPYETDAQLISEGLIRADENYKPDEKEEAKVEKNDVIEFTSADATAAKYGETKVSRSLMGKLIQSGEDLQILYEGMKNALLSYSGVKARMSRTRESFNKGRIKAASITIRGKSILLSLALDPKAYDVSKYHHEDKSVPGKDVDLPFLLKVRSNRSYKYALELIGEVMETKGIAFGELATEVYRYEYMTDAELVDQGLASVSGGGALSPYKKNYDYSFVAAVTLAPKSMIGWYSDVKNSFMSYKNVHSKMGEYYETIYKGREILARFSVKNDQLTCFMSLDPDEIMQGTCPHRAFTMIPFLEETPMAVVISSPRIVIQVENTIEEYLSKKFKLTKNSDYRIEDYAFENKSEQQLITGGFIHVISEDEPEEDEPEVIVTAEEKPGEAVPATEVEVTETSLEGNLATETEVTETSPEGNLAEETEVTENQEVESLTSGAQEVETLIPEPQEAETVAPEVAAAESPIVETTVTEEQSGSQDSEPGPVEVAAPVQENISVEVKNDGADANGESSAEGEENVSMEELEEIMRSLESEMPEIQITEPEEEKEEFIPLFEEDDIPEPEGKEDTSRNIMYKIKNFLKKG